MARVIGPCIAIVLSTLVGQAVLAQPGKIRPEQLKAGYRYRSPYAQPARVTGQPHQNYNSASSGYSSGYDYGSGGYSSGAYGAGGMGGAGMSGMGGMGGAGMSGMGGMGGAGMSGMGGMGGAGMGGMGGMGGAGMGGMSGMGGGGGLGQMFRGGGGSRERQQEEEEVQPDINAGGPSSMMGGDIDPNAGQPAMGAGLSPEPQNDIRAQFRRNYSLPDNFKQKNSVPEAGITPSAPGLAADDQGFNGSVGGPPIPTNLQGIGGVKDQSFYSPRKRLTGPSWTPPPEPPRPPSGIEPQQGIIDQDGYF